MKNRYTFYVSDMTLMFYSRSFPLGIAIQGFLFLLLITMVLHILDRQGDFVARTDFIWKAKLKVEQDEVETMRGINKVLVNYIFIFDVYVQMYLILFSVSKLYMDM